MFIGNHDWTVSSAGANKSFRSLLEEQLGPVSYYIGGKDGMPYKPRQTPQVTSFPRRRGASAKSSMLETRRMT